MKCKNTDPRVLEATCQQFNEIHLTDYEVLKVKVKGKKTKREMALIRCRSSGHKQWRATSLPLDKLFPMCQKGADFAVNGETIKVSCVNSKMHREWRKKLEDKAFTLEVIRVWKGEHNHQGLFRCTATREGQICGAEFQRARNYLDTSCDRGYYICPESECSQGNMRTAAFYLEAAREAMQDGADNNAEALVAVIRVARAGHDGTLLPADTPLRSAEVILIVSCGPCSDAINHGTWGVPWRAFLKNRLRARKQNGPVRLGCYSGRKECPNHAEDKSPWARAHQISVTLTDDQRTGLTDQETKALLIVESVEVLGDMMVDAINGEINIGEKPDPAVVLALVHKRQLRNVQEKPHLVHKLLNEKGEEVRNSTDKVGYVEGYEHYTNKAMRDPDSVVYRELAPVFGYDAAERKLDHMASIEMGTHVTEAFSYVRAMVNKEEGGGLLKWATYVPDQNMPGCASGDTKSFATYINGASKVLFKLVCGAHGGRHGCLVFHGRDGETIAILTITEKIDDEVAARAFKTILYHQEAAGTHGGYSSTMVEKGARLMMLTAVAEDIGAKIWWAHDYVQDTKDTLAGKGVAPGLLSLCEDEIVIYDDEDSEVDDEELDAASQCG